MTAVSSTSSTGPRLSRGTHLGYALGSIATAAFGTVPGATAARVPGLLADLAAAARRAAALPRPIAERLLAGVLGQVYRPTP
ncbi:hypothetical protein [Blastococcus sp. PRF04-17]|uniref:hypothetical protein n=1 Tax=Blastococcus sp. PRF04-17 TaxID=2933797 RepID=UPI001FF122C7|nr:hypothetical protein [Blastococcus sp. PRF04-17]UOY01364.1 hypothetical protein MVA48_20860 [Blastococcus sp. PRF04-17]